ncbi:hypothetical protein [Parvicella tangerina]|uniref:Uncharacterized protein n=1 Tax=Parvicella tangerina TaxID=2829795 RepID=A0A916JMD9_9FLAO|nr:hypothetical protein [Parvicella tangerina]CAG5081516.1 hypothetical protein CRYO30217_01654 [Parvicella tangerina]
MRVLLHIIILLYSTSLISQTIETADSITECHFKELISEFNSLFSSKKVKELSDEQLVFMAKVYNSTEWDNVIKLAPDEVKIFRKDFYKFALVEFPKRFDCEECNWYGENILCKDIQLIIGYQDLTGMEEEHMIPIIPCKK